MRLVAGWLTIVLAGCAPSVGERLAEAERSLAGGDASAAALEFAEVVEATEPGTAEWLAAKRGVVRSIVGELPERAVRELEELSTDHPEAVTLDDWIDVIGRVASTERFDLARTLVGERSASASPAECERLDRIERALEAAAARSRTLDRLAPFAGWVGLWTPWAGEPFEPAGDVAELCAEIARSTDTAYAGYLALAKRRLLGPDDYGALALGFYNEWDREHALWVLWTACFEHPGDAHLRDLAEFVRYGPSRSIPPLHRICDY
ncbi:MAG: hypothetical protein L6Q99_04670 [Planctomycetes bacterium]|nr:hypothetical protein [Planctomycetota bacterium]